MAGYTGWSRSPSRHPTTALAVIEVLVAFLSPQQSTTGPTHNTPTGANGTSRASAPTGSRSAGGTRPCSPAARLHATDPPLDLQGLDLRGANIRASLTASTLRPADLSRADFRGTDLRGAYFSTVYLESANFEGADLRGADFESVEVPDVDFVECRGIDTGGVDCRGTGIDDADFRGALADSFTKWPFGGFDWQAAGIKMEER